MLNLYSAVFKKEREQKAFKTRGKPIHGRSATASMLWKVSNAFCSHSYQPASCFLSARAGCI